MIKVPQAIRKERYRMYISGFGVLFASGGIGFLLGELRPNWLPDDARSLISAVCFGLAVVLMIWSAGVEKRVRRMVESHDGCVCTRCAYPVAKDLTQGTCPECGLKYTLQDMRMEWWDYGADIKRAMKSD